MIDVAVAIDGEAVNVVLSRAAPGSWGADGKFTAGAETTTAIRAAVQPVSGRQLMDMPEGIRAEARWLAWSRSELRLDDTIAHGGQNYRVMHVWPRAEGGFWRAAMGLVTV